MRNLRASEMTDAPWYLAQSKPNQEHLAAQRLRRHGSDVFLPRLMRAQRWRGRLRTVSAPVFSGYVFFSPDPERPEWQRVNRTPGVTRLVRFGVDGPAAVPSSLVLGLMMRCDTQGNLLPPDDLQPGEAVRVTAGPFAEMISTIEEIDANARITLLLEIMGRTTRVKVPAGDVVRSRGTEGISRA
jgi:transcriptional antiterminator RfaH